MEYKIKIHGIEYEVNIHKVEDNIAHLTVNDVDFEVEVEELTINPTRMSLEPSVKTVQPDVPLGKQQTQTPTSILEIRSPLPGIINDVLVKEGDKVKLGQKLMVLEAMKMENSIEAEREGVIEKINRRKGDSVLEGDILLTIK